MKDISINQKSYPVTAPTDRLPWKITQTGNGKFELLDGRGTRLKGHAVSARDGLWVFLDGHGYFVQAPKERRSDQVHGGGADADGGGVLISPMPAKVFKLHVKKGDAVKKGQELIVLEAMKMEHALVADKDGVIAKCSIQEGQMVDLGQELIVIT